MPEKRKHLTDIPYRPGSSEHNRFWNRMRELTGTFAGCDSFYFSNHSLGDILEFPSAEGNLIETRLGKHDTHMEPWWYDLLPVGNLDPLEELLKTHKIDYIRNAKFYGLCCDETTKESESIFLLNHPRENVLFISSPAELFRIKAIAYTSRINRQAKTLEKNISERHHDMASGVILLYDDVPGIFLKEGACPRCYGEFEEKLKKKALERMKSAEWALYKDCGAGKGVYESDPRIRILLKEPVLDFNKRYFIS